MEGDITRVTSLTHREAAVLAQLRASLAENDVSVGGLGKALGEPKSTANHILRGEASLTIGRLLTLAHRLGVRPVDIVPLLVGGPTEPPDEIPTEVLRMPVATLVALAEATGQAAADICPLVDQLSPA